MLRSMSAAVRQLINDVIAIETGGDADGGYTNHPNDLGGPTRWGVTEKTARSNGYDDDMRDYPRAAAFDVYMNEYVRSPGFGRVLALSPMIGGELVAAGINLGPSRPSRWLQENLNIFNRQERDYDDIATDGIIGNATIGALHDYLAVRDGDGDEILTRALNVSQGAEYQRLAHANEKLEMFVYGWFRKRVCICPQHKTMREAA